MPTTPPPSPRILTAASAALLLMLAGCSSLVEAGPGGPVLDPTRTQVVVPAEGFAGRERVIRVTLRDTDGSAFTGEGTVPAVGISGATLTGAAVQHVGGGIWEARYTPTGWGIDTVAVTVAGSPVPGGPFVSVTWLGGRGTPEVDGVIGEEEWSGGSRVLAFPSVSHHGPGVLRIMNDDDSLYVAVEFPASVRDAFGVFVYFDNTLDNARSRGDDTFVISPAGLADGWYDGLDWQNDDTFHGRIAEASDSAHVRWEVARPLDSGDEQDVALTPGQVVGICVEVNRAGIAATNDDAYPRRCQNVLFGQQDYARLKVTGP